MDNLHYKRKEKQAKTIIKCLTCINNLSSSEYFLNGKYCTNCLSKINREIKNNGTANQ